MMGLLADAWIRGLTDWQMLLGHGSSNGNRSEGARNPVDVIGSVADMAARLGAPAADAVGARTGSEAAFSQVADMSPAFAQAGLVTAACAVRYWYTISELLARYQSNLVRAATDRAIGRAASPAECRVLVDELRALLRQVGDAAMHEARRLQQDLDLVCETIGQTASNPTRSPPTTQVPQRRLHRVKA